MLQIARALFVLLLVVATVLVSVTVDRLPEHIASHFAANGVANGWMDRNAYLLFMLGFAVGTPIAVVLAMGFVPRRMPNAINLPNRDYWLAPARSEETLCYLEAHAYWFGSLLLVFMVALHGLLLVANATQPPHLPGPPFVMLLTAFLVATAWWGVTLVLHFRRGR
jgi:uncharacterized membrane protein